MIKALILSVIVATTVADDKCDYYGQKYEDGETWFDDKLKMRCTVNEKGSRINAVACLTPTKKEVWPGDEVIEGNLKYSCVHDGGWLKSVWSSI